MKLPRFSCMSSILFLAFWIVGVSSIQAQEGTAPAPVVATVPAPAPAPAPAAVDAPKVTAKKEDEPETEPATPAATAPPVNLNLNWLQRQVAAVASIPTETTNAAALATLTAERDSLSSQLATLNASAATLQAENTRLCAELATMNGFVDQLRNAPAALRTADPASLTPPQQAAAAAIAAGVSAELRLVGQPAAQLPGPTAEKPVATLSPAAQEQQEKHATAQSYWSKRKAPWAAN